MSQLKRSGTKKDKNNKIFYPKLTHRDQKLRNSNEVSMLSNNDSAHLEFCDGRMLHLQ